MDEDAVLVVLHVLKRARKRAKIIRWDHKMGCWKLWVNATYRIQDGLYLDQNASDEEITRLAIEHWPYSTRRCRLVIVR